MERKFDHDEFEQFLKDSAEGLRMRPSPAVWKALSRELGRKRRRIAGFVVLALALLTGGYFTWQATATKAVEIVAKNSPADKPVVSLPAPQSTETKTAAGDISKGVKATPENTYVVARQKVFLPAKNAARNISEGLPTIPEKTAIAPEETTALTTSNTTFKAAPIHLLQAGKKNLNTDLKEAVKISVTTEVAQPSVAAAQKQRDSRKLQWHLFATPTVSYRKLSDNKGYQRPILTTGIPATVSALYGINSAVTHKPDLGIEFGLMAKYPVTRNLKLRTGFQFNISRYDIRAFSYVPEVATIALNNGFRVDSVRAISSYRNFSGGRTNWLQNFYFQASLPVGMELKVLGNNKTYAGIASSIQPTYVIGNRAYMITADYKNYARVPWLIRRWNMNTNFEAFITHRTRKTEWQVGPQVRYQILSSFINEYPVKENLFDFGLKVGVRIR